MTADYGLESGLWLKRYGNDGEKSEGLEDLIMPATGGKHVIRTQGIIGSPVIATDGETGSIRTFLFDDQSWKVCCLVVDVGGWLKRRDVVLPVAALEQPDWANRTCCESNDRRRPTLSIV